MTSGRGRKIGMAKFAVVGTTLMAAALGGCVSQQQHDLIKDQLYALRDQNSLASTEIENLRAALELQRSSKQSSTMTLSDLEAENADLRSKLNSTNDLLAELDSQIRGLNLSEIDPKLDQALRNLAAQYPSVIIYDADRGMLRFASDLTFGSGSDQVRDGAKQTLASLANVIKNQAAGAYELQIIGHTDAEPISSGTAQRHPTNTHLSVHRAIAVKQQLVQLGVPTNRVMVAGWGENKPAVPNNAGGNTPQNRRVEVFFRPESTDGIAAAPAAQPAGRDEPAQAVFIEPTK